METGDDRRPIGPLGLNADVIFLTVKLFTFRCKNRFPRIMDRYINYK